MFEMSMYNPGPTWAPPYTCCPPWPSATWSITVLPAKAEQESEPEKPGVYVKLTNGDEEVYFSAGRVWVSGDGSLEVYGGSRVAGGVSAGGWLSYRVVPPADNGEESK